MSLFDDEVNPIFAQAFFAGSRNGTIKEFLQFDYHDPACFYKTLEQDQKELDIELTKLSTNMQTFLDQEKNAINDQQVFPEVKFIDLGFRGETMPFITWIIEFNATFNKGLNEYAAITPEEKLDYNCRSLWTFTEGTRIIKIETPMNYEICENHVAFWASKNDVIGGKEIIRFIIKE
ncbi:MAG: hypothetical protein EU521_00480 [Promethearchaeota archaeon]|nr:MAG: hypothetical protein EU521_00480 [Candidatus Lokiarchaeota archaeon]